MDFINQMILTNTAEHSTLKRECNFFSAPHGIFSKVDDILGHNTILNRCKKTEVTPCILSDYHGSQLDIKNNKNNKQTNPETRKLTKSWKANNSLLRKMGQDRNKDGN